MKKTTALSSRLRSLISSANVTQKDLAEAVGVKPQSISQYIDGASNPSYSVLIAIADFFHVSTDYLLGRSDVSTEDMNVSTISSKLGLSETTVDIIIKNSVVIERLLSNNETSNLLNSLKLYHDYSIGTTGKGRIAHVYSVLSGHELRVASYALGNIFKASEDEEAWEKFEIKVIHGEAPPLSDDEIQIVIPKEAAAEDIENIIGDAMIADLQKRGML